MKKLNFFNKIIFLINNIIAILLLLSFFVSYIRPSSFSLAPIIGLTIPALFFMNVLFVIYWIIIGFKKQFLLSTIVLVLSYFIVTPIYKLVSSGNKEASDQLTIMTYNVRKFNQKKWINDTEIPKKIETFITEQNPDIVALQEYEQLDSFLSNYPYNYNPRANKLSMSGLAIFSKHPIINQGKIKSREHPNRAIFIDILKNEDTLRLYNFHFQSLGLIPDKEFLGQENSDRLLRRLKQAFKVQEKQLLEFHDKPIAKHQKTILVGDMNNTPYSWIYRSFKSDFNDSFLKAGKGFGKTYSFKGFPLRIDYIFADPTMQVLGHKNYQVNYSDHYPIMATVSF